MNRSTPSISVVIPTYQRRDEVIAAIWSVLAQVSPADQIIVVDDGSQDGTEAALDALGARVNVLRLPHQGAAAARNAGLDVATGDLVAFLDSDDHWDPNHLATLRHLFISNPEAVAVSAVRGFFPVFHRTGRSRVRLVRALPRLLIGNFVGFPSCTAVRRSDLAAVGGFDDRLRASEFYDLWIRLAARGPFCLASSRTVSRAASAGSLSRWAIRSGAMLEDRTLIGVKLAAQGGADAKVSEAAIESYQHFVAGLGLLSAGDDAPARLRFADACRLAPERSCEPSLIGGWMGLTPAGDGQGRAAMFSRAAAAWPDAWSRTALALRAHGSVLAIGQRINGPHAHPRL